MKSFTIIFVCMIRGLLNNPIEVYNVDESGALFENQGELVIYRSEILVYTRLKLVSVEDMEGYNMNIQTLLKKSCNLLTKVKGQVDTNCLWWINNLKKQAMSLKEEIEKINHFFTHRKKRGIIDGIGAISKSLFGTMDSEDSLRINDLLEKLQKTGEKRLEIFSQHTAVVTSTFEILKNNVLNLTANMMELDHKVNNIENQVAEGLNALGKGVATNTFQIELNQIIAIATNKYE